MVSYVREQSWIKRAKTMLKLRSSQKLQVLEEVNCIRSLGNKRFLHSCAELHWISESHAAWKPALQAFSSLSYLPPESCSERAGFLRNGYSRQVLPWGIFPTPHKPSEMLSWMPLDIEKKGKKILKIPKLQTKNPNIFTQVMLFFIKLSMPKLHTLKK